MDSNKTVKKQILIRAMQQPYMACDVIGAHSEAIFGKSPEDNLIANVVSRYYYQHKEPLTENVLNMLLGKQLDFMVKNNQLTDGKKVVKYFHDADDLLNGKIDTSGEMTDAISKFVHGQIATREALNAVSKYERSDRDYPLASHLRDILDKISTLDVTGQGSSVIDVFDPDSFEAQEKAFESLNKDKIPLGISNIDEATNGGLEKGSTNLINATSGTGKTTLLTNFSISYVMHGYNVFHISLEEMTSDMLIRFCRIALHMTPDQLFGDDGKLDKNAEVKIFQEYMGLSDHGYQKKHFGKLFHLGQLYFFRTSPRTMTVDGLRQLIMSTERLHGVKFDVIVLDYPALLINPYSYHGANESSAGEKLFQDLKKLAVDTNTVIWLASQLNRMSTNADIKSADFMEGSYRKINSVNTSFTLNRTSKEFQNNCFRLHVDKLRNRDNYDQEYLFFKYQNMKTVPENSSEIQQHQDLLGQSESSRKMNYRKKINANSQAKQNQIKQLNG